VLDRALDNLLATHNQPQGWHLGGPNDVCGQGLNPMLEQNDFVFAYFETVFLSQISLSETNPSRPMARDTARAVVVTGCLFLMRRADWDRQGFD
jgi:hypothetical protein